MATQAGLGAEAVMDGEETGRKFDLPVDSEHKALKIKIFSIARPHMRAFHLCWLAFFSTFVSTFAPAAMLPVIREDLDLNASSLGDAGVAAVSGTIASRVIMGSVCDILGPRLGMATILLLTASPTFGMALANQPLDFIMLRFAIGISLGSFVACQYWTSSMFNVKIVGIANATTGGWGNLGGGVTQLIMPLIYEGLTDLHAPFVAWRWAFFVPGFLQILTGMFILFFSEDLPDGNFAVLRKSGKVKADSNGLKIAWVALRNYRTWCLTITYGFCFGVELTINNIIVSYLFDQFGVSLSIAGVLGSLFGLMNLFARSVGGAGSDIAGKYYGMRGRLWALYTLQTLEGILCIAMGLAKGTLAGTIVLMIAFSLCVQASEGATYGVVPFVSKRALGFVSGMVGAGGSAGSVITQAIFFKGRYSTYDGLVWMGVMICAMTVLVLPIYFAQWGGCFCPAKDDYTEEDYYLSEYSPEERAAGMADAALRFAQESRSQRGLKNAKNESQEGVKPGLEQT